MNGTFSWRNLSAKFIKCLHDDRGVAMTEYLLVTGVTLPIVFYLFNPDNGMYQSAREQYDQTVTMLMFPGP